MSSTRSGHLSSSLQTAYSGAVRKTYDQTSGVATGRAQGGGVQGTRNWTPELVFQVKNFDSLHSDGFKLLSQIK
jgi:hypothetical protein